MCGCGCVTLLLLSPPTAKVSESQRAVQAANRDLTQATRQHEEYRKRATGILQVRNFNCLTQTLHQLIGLSPRNMV